MYYMLFFFKKKTAYEMRISDWSSDVCSSDLHRGGPDPEPEGIVADAGMRAPGGFEDHVLGIVAGEDRDAGQREAADPHHRVGHRDLAPDAEIGRATWRERV